MKLEIFPVEFEFTFSFPLTVKNRIYGIEIQRILPPRIYFTAVNLQMSRVEGLGVSILFVATLQDSLARLVAIIRVMLAAGQLVFSALYRPCFRGMQ